MELRRGTCRRGTEDKELCGWGAAGGNIARSGGGRRAYGLLFEIGSSWNRCGKADRCGRRVDSLMAEMTDGAGVGRGVDVMVPNHTERRPQDQGENRHGENKTPDSLAVGHVEGDRRGTAATV